MARYLVTTLSSTASHLLRTVPCLPSASLTYDFWVKEVRNNLIMFLVRPVPQKRNQQITVCFNPFWVAHNRLVEGLYRQFLGYEKVLLCQKNRTGWAKCAESTA